MLQSFIPSQDWDCGLEPLFFDEEFRQDLLKDLQMFPTPPQSPPIKPGCANMLSKVEQLEFVSELLIEDQDFAQLNWNYETAINTDNINSANCKDQRPEVSEDCLWHCISEKSTEKLSTILSTSPLLSEIDTSIFEEIAGSTLDCHSAALACQSLESNTDLSQDTLESSDFSSMSTGSESSTSDSEDEIDVVTVKRACGSSRAAQAKSCRRLRAIKRCHLEIQLQHNYAAPCPASPPRTEPSPPTPRHKRVRAEPQRLQLSTGSRCQKPGSRHTTEQDEEEEERRRTHNVMERQRRNELKNCFLRLRDCVPELSNNDKASKVVILKRARDCICGLEVESRRLATRKDKLKHRQEQLKARLEQLG